MPMPFLLVFSTQGDPLAQKSSQSSRAQILHPLDPEAKSQISVFIKQLSRLKAYQICRLLDLCHYLVELVCFFTLWKRGLILCEGLCNTRRVCFLIYESPSLLPVVLD